MCMLSACCQSTMKNSTTSKAHAIKLNGNYIVTLNGNYIVTLNGNLRHNHIVIYNCYNDFLETTMILITMIPSMKRNVYYPLSPIKQNNCIEIYNFTAR